MHLGHIMVEIQLFNMCEIKWLAFSYVHLTFKALLKDNFLGLLQSYRPLMASHFKTFIKHTPFLKDAFPLYEYDYISSYLLNVVIFV